MLDSPPLPFAGVDNDETIKVSRSGGADPDGNQPGDLYIVIKVTIYIYIYIFFFFVQCVIICLFLVGTSLLGCLPPNP